MIVHMLPCRKQSNLRKGPICDFKVTTVTWLLCYLLKPNSGNQHKALLLSHVSKVFPMHPWPLSILTPHDDVLSTSYF